MNENIDDDEFEVREERQPVNVDNEPVAADEQYDHNVVGAGVTEGVPGGDDEYEVTNQQPEPQPPVQQTQGPPQTRARKKLVPTQVTSYEEANELKKAQKETDTRPTYQVKQRKVTKEEDPDVRRMMEIDRFVGSESQGMKRLKRNADVVEDDYGDEKEDENMIDDTGAVRATKSQVARYNQLNSVKGKNFEQILQSMVVGGSISGEIKNELKNSMFDFYSSAFSDPPPYHQLQPNELNQVRTHEWNANLSNKLTSVVLNQLTPIGELRGAPFYTFGVLNVIQNPSRGFAKDVFVGSIPYDIYMKQYVEKVKYTQRTQDVWQVQALKNVRDYVDAATLVEQQIDAGAGALVGSLKLIADKFRNPEGPLLSFNEQELTLMANALRFIEQDQPVIKPVNIRGNQGIVEQLTQSNTKLQSKIIKDRASSDKFFKWTDTTKRQAIVSKDGGVVELLRGIFKNIQFSPQEFANNQFNVLTQEIPQLKASKINKSNSLIKTLIEYDSLLPPTSLINDVLMSSNQSYSNNQQIQKYQPGEVYSTFGINKFLADQNLPVQLNEYVFDRQGGQQEMLNYLSGLQVSQNLTDFGNAVYEDESYIRNATLNNQINVLQPSSRSNITYAVRAKNKTNEFQQHDNFKGVGDSNFVQDVLSLKSLPVSKDTKIKGGQLPQEFIQYMAGTNSQYVPPEKITDLKFNSKAEQQKQTFKIFYENPNKLQKSQLTSGEGDAVMQQQLNKNLVGKYNVLVRTPAQEKTKAQNEKEIENAISEAWQLKYLTKGNQYLWDNLSLQLNQNLGIDKSKPMQIDNSNLEQPEIEGTDFDLFTSLTSQNNSQFVINTNQLDIGEVVRNIQAMYNNTILKFGNILKKNREQNEEIKGEEEKKKQPNEDINFKYVTDYLQTKLVNEYPDFGDDVKDRSVFDSIANISELLHVDELSIKKLDQDIIQDINRVTDFLDYINKDEILNKEEDIDDLRKNFMHFFYKKSNIQDDRDHKQLYQYAGMHNIGTGGGGEQTIVPPIVGEDLRQVNQTTINSLKKKIQTIDVAKKYFNKLVPDRFRVMKVDQLLENFNEQGTQTENKKMTDAGQGLILQKWGKIKDERKIENVVDQEGRQLNMKIGKKKGRWFVTNPGIFSQYKQSFQQMYPDFFKGKTEEQLQNTIAIGLITGKYRQNKADEEVLDEGDNSSFRNEYMYFFEIKKPQNMNNAQYNKVLKNLMERQTNLQDSKEGIGFNVFNEINTKNGLQLVYDDAYGPQSDVSRALSNYNTGLVIRLIQRHREGSDFSRATQEYHVNQFLQNEKDLQVQSVAGQMTEKQMGLLRILNGYAFGGLKVESQGQINLSTKQEKLQDNQKVSSLFRIYNKLRGEFLALPDVDPIVVYLNAINSTRDAYDQKMMKDVMASVVHSGMVNQQGELDNITLERNRREYMDDVQTAKIQKYMTDDIASSIDFYVIGRKSTNPRKEKTKQDLIDKLLSFIEVNDANLHRNSDRYMEQLNSQAGKFNALTLGLKDLATFSKDMRWRMLQGLNDGDIIGSLKNINQVIPSTFSQETLSEIAKQTGMLYYDLSRGLFGSIEGKMFASSFDNIKYESNRFAMYDRARKSVGALTEIKKKGEMAAGLAAQQFIKNIAPVYVDVMMRNMLETEQNNLEAEVVPFIKQGFNYEQQFSNFQDQLNDQMFFKAIDITDLGKIFPNFMLDSIQSLAYQYTHLPTTQLSTEQFGKFIDDASDVIIPYIKPILGKILADQLSNQLVIPQSLEQFTQSINGMLKLIDQGIDTKNIKRQILGNALIAGVQNQLGVISNSVANTLTQSTYNKLVGLTPLEKQYKTPQFLGDVYTQAMLGASQKSNLLKKMTSYTVGTLKQITEAEKSDQNVKDKHAKIFSQQVQLLNDMEQALELQQTLTTFDMLQDYRSRSQQIKEQFGVSNKQMTLDVGIQKKLQNTRNNYVKNVNFSQRFTQGEQNLTNARFEIPDTGNQQHQSLTTDALVKSRFILFDDETMEGVDGNKAKSTASEVNKRKRKMTTAPPEEENKTLKTQRINQEQRTVGGEMPPPEQQQTSVTNKRNAKAKTKKVKFEEETKTMEEPKLNELENQMKSVFNAVSRQGEIYASSGGRAIIFSDNSRTRSQTKEKDNIADQQVIDDPTNLKGDVIRSKGSVTWGEVTFDSFRQIQNAFKFPSEFTQRSKSKLLSSQSRYEFTNDEHGVMDNMFGMTHNDLFVDIGSGLGQIVWANALGNKVKSIGFEIQENRHQYANDLAKTKVAGLKNVDQSLVEFHYEDVVRQTPAHGYIDSNKLLTPITDSLGKHVTHIFAFSARFQGKQDEDGDMAQIAKRLNNTNWKMLAWSGDNRFTTSHINGAVPIGQVKVKMQGGKFSNTFNVFLNDKLNQNRYHQNHKWIGDNTQNNEMDYDDQRFELAMQLPESLTPVVQLVSQEYAAQNKIQSLQDGMEGSQINFGTNDINYIAQGQMQEKGQQKQMQEEEKVGVQQQIDTIVNNQEDISGTIKINAMEGMYGNLIDQIRNFGSIQQAVGKTKAKALFNKVKASLNVDLAKSEREESILLETFDGLKKLMNQPEGVSVVNQIMALHDDGQIDANEIQSKDVLFNRGLDRIKAASNISTGVTQQLMEYQILVNQMREMWDTIKTTGGQFNKNIFDYNSAQPTNAFFNDIADQEAKYLAVIQNDNMLVNEKVAYANQVAGNTIKNIVEQLNYNLDPNQVKSYIQNSIKDIHDEVENLFKQKQQFGIEQIARAGLILDTIGKTRATIEVFKGAQNAEYIKQNLVQTLLTDPSEENEYMNYVNEAVNDLTNTVQKGIKVNTGRFKNLSQNFPTWINKIQEMTQNNQQALIGQMQAFKNNFDSMVEIGMDMYMQKNQQYVVETQQRELENKRLQDENQALMNQIAQQQQQPPVAAAAAAAATGGNGSGEMSATQAQTQSQQQQQQQQPMVNMVSGGGGMPPSGDDNGDDDDDDPNKKQPPNIPNQPEDYKEEQNKQTGRRELKDFWDEDMFARYVERIGGHYPVQPNSQEERLQYYIQSNLQKLMDEMGETVKRMNNAEIMQALILGVEQKSRENQLGNPVNMIMARSGLLTVPEEMKESNQIAEAHIKSSQTMQMTQAIAQNKQTKSKINTDQVKQYHQQENLQYEIEMQKTTQEVKSQAARYIALMKTAQQTVQNLRKKAQKEEGKSRPTGEFDVGDFQVILGYFKSQPYISSQTKAIITSKMEEMDQIYVGDYNVEQVLFATNASQLVDLIGQLLRTDLFAQYGNQLEQFGVYYMENDRIAQQLGQNFNLKVLNQQYETAVKVSEQLYNQQQLNNYTTQRKAKAAQKQTEVMIDPNNNEYVNALKLMKENETERMKMNTQNEVARIQIDNDEEKKRQTNDEQYQKDVNAKYKEAEEAKTTHQQNMRAEELAALTNKITNQNTQAANELDALKKKGEKEKEEAKQRKQNQEQMTTYTKEKNYYTGTMDTQREASKIEQYRDQSQYTVYQSMVQRDKAIEQTNISKEENKAMKKQFKEQQKAQMAMELDNSQYRQAMAELKTEMIQEREDNAAWENTYKLEEQRKQQESEKRRDVNNTMTQNTIKGYETKRTQDQTDQLIERNQNLIDYKETEINQQMVRTHANMQFDRQMASFNSQNATNLANLQNQHNALMLQSHKDEENAKYWQKSFNFTHQENMADENKTQAQNVAAAEKAHHTNMLAKKKEENKNFLEELKESNKYQEDLLQDKLTHMGEEQLLASEHHKELISINKFIATTKEAQMKARLKNKNELDQLAITMDHTLKMDQLDRENTMNTALNTTRQANYVEEKKAEQTKTDLAKSKVQQAMTEKKDRITNEKAMAEEEKRQLAAYKTHYDTTGKQLVQTKQANIKEAGAQALQKEKDAKTLEAEEEKQEKELLDEKKKEYEARKTTRANILQHQHDQKLEGIKDSIAAQEHQVSLLTAKNEAVELARQEESIIAGDITGLKIDQMTNDANYRLAQKMGDFQLAQAQLNSQVVSNAAYNYSDALKHNVELAKEDTKQRQQYLKLQQSMQRLQAERTAALNEKMLLEQQFAVQKMREELQDQIKQDKIKASASKAAEKMASFQQEQEIAALQDQIDEDSQAVDKMKQEFEHKQKIKKLNKKLDKINEEIKRGDDEVDEVISSVEEISNMMAAKQMLNTFKRFGYGEEITQKVLQLQSKLQDQIDRDDVPQHIDILMQALDTTKIFKKQIKEANDQKMQTLMKEADDAQFTEHFKTFVEEYQNISKDTVSKLYDSYLQHMQRCDIFPSLKKEQLLQKYTTPTITTKEGTSKFFASAGIQGNIPIELSRAQQKFRTFTNEISQEELKLVVEKDTTNSGSILANIIALSEYLGSQLRQNEKNEIQKRYIRDAMEKLRDFTVDNKEDLVKKNHFQIENEISKSTEEGRAGVFMGKGQQRQQQQKQGGEGQQEYHRSGMGQQKQSAKIGQFYQGSGFGRDVRYDDQSGGYIQGGGGGGASAPTGRTGFTGQDSINAVSDYDRRQKFEKRRARAIEDDGQKWDANKGDYVNMTAKEKKEAKAKRKAKKKMKKAIKKKVKKELKKDKKKKKEKKEKKKKKKEKKEDDEKENKEK